MQQNTRSSPTTPCIGRAGFVRIYACGEPTNLLDSTNVEKGSGKQESSFVDIDCLRLKEQMDTMDMERMKVLDRHAFLFVLMHSLFVVSLAYDFISFY